MRPFVRSRAALAAAAAACVLVLVAPSPAHASGFMLTNGFAPPAGHVWAKLSYAQWHADKEFAGVLDRNTFDGVHIGDVRPFNDNTMGEVDTHSMGVNLVFAPLERIQIDAYMAPVQQVHFRNTEYDSRAIGTGDVFVAAGYQLVPSPATIATSLGLQVKIPTTPLPKSTESLPLTEGQYDIALEQASTWVPTHSMQVTLRTLVRHRFEFQDATRRIDPGDEAELGLSVGGGPLSWLWLSGGYAGLWSTGTVDLSGGGPGDIQQIRQLHELWAGTYIKWGELFSNSLSELALDASVRYPIAGRDYPQGLTVSVGLAWGGQFRLPWGK